MSRAEIFIYSQIFQKLSPEVVLKAAMGQAFFQFKFRYGRHHDVWILLT